MKCLRQGDTHRERRARSCALGVLRHPSPKKSVALSGVTAGNTALCTVGRTGNDLHYRGYDILDVAEACNFEEIAHLLVHGTLPNQAELTAYTSQARQPCAVCPVPCWTFWNPCLRPRIRWMSCARAVSALGCALPEKEDHNAAGARDIADRLMASLGSMLLYWFHFAQNGKPHRCAKPMMTSIAGHFLSTCFTAAPHPDEWVRAMDTSLILYAEHEFNASTFAARVVAGTGSDMYSAITAGIGALARPQAWRRQ